jgi:hypothetical protein
MEETPLHLIGCPSLPSLVVVASLWLWSMVHKKKNTGAVLSLCNVWR